MCGRFYVLLDGEEDEGQAKEFCPTDEYEVLTKNGWERMRWGFPRAEGGVHINARAETVAVKPTFRRAFEMRRCLVRSSGFYEWQRVEGKKSKDRYRLFREDGEALMMAGIYNEQREFVIITQPPNETVAPLHDRMPVLMPTAEMQTLWLHEDDMAPLLLSMQPDASLRAWHEADPPPDVDQITMDL